MRIHVLSFFTSLFFTSSASGTSSLVLRDVPARPATYADVYALQALGRFIVSPDGNFFLYEWGRPYLNWVPPRDGIAPITARRLQTFLFKVDTTTDAPTSEYLLEPSAGATYWLGSLSPDSSRVSFYELDRDDNRSRTGVWNLKEQKVMWFDLEPDDRRFDSMSPWLSNEEFVYPIKSRSLFARANLVTGKAITCTECGLNTVSKAETASEEIASEARMSALKIDAADLLQGAVLRAVSENGNLGIFVRDDAEQLQLLIKQPGWAAYKVFENFRKWPKPVPSEGRK